MQRLYEPPSQHLSGQSKLLNLDKHPQGLIKQLAKGMIRKPINFFLSGRTSSFCYTLTASPSFGDLAPFIGGYLIPHE